MAEKEKRTSQTIDRFTWLLPLDKMTSPDARNSEDEEDDEDLDENKDKKSFRPFKKKRKEKRSSRPDMDQTSKEVQQSPRSNSARKEHTPSPRSVDRSPRDKLYKHLQIFRGTVPNINTNNIIPCNGDEDERPKSDRTPSGINRRKSEGDRILFETQKRASAPDQFSEMTESSDSKSRDVLSISDNITGATEIYHGESESDSTVAHGRAAFHVTPTKKKITK